MSNIIIHGTQSPVVVNGVSLTPIEIDGQRYVTFAQVDQTHKRAPGTASRNFRENRNRFIDGEDFRPTNFVDLQKSGFANPSPNG